MKNCEYEINGLCFNPKNKELRLLAVPCDGGCTIFNDKKTKTGDKKTMKNQNHLEIINTNVDTTEEFCFNPAHLKPGILAVKKEDCEYCHE
jgi:hypothetical protein